MIIELSKGRDLYEVRIDPDMAWAFEQWKWTVSDWGYLKRYSSRRVPGKPWPVSADVYYHTWIMACPPGYQVDHRDGDTLHCRRANLEIVTKAENVARATRRRYGHDPFEPVRDVA